MTAVIGVPSDVAHEVLAAEAVGGAAAFLLATLVLAVYRRRPWHGWLQVLARWLLVVAAFCAVGVVTLGLSVWAEDDPCAFVEDDDEVVIVDGEEYRCVEDE